MELGKLMGARVIACASSDEKLEIARRYGADHAINYREHDLKAELKRFDDGVDVIYDPVSKREVYPFAAFADALKNVAAGRVHGKAIVDLRG